MSIPFQAYFALAAVLALIVLIQRKLFRTAVRGVRQWLPDARAARRAENILRPAFILLNLPWAVLLSVALSDRLELWITQSTTGYAALRGLMYPFAIWQCGGVFACLLLVVGDGVRRVSNQLTGWRGAPSAPPEKDAPGKLARREWLQSAGGGLAALPFIVSIYGALEASQFYAVEPTELFLEGWPKELDGLRIAQLTDIHVGVFMSEHRLREVVQAVNRLEPDLVALTGDYVSSSSVFVKPCIRALSELRARYGVFASIGNHDVFTDSVAPLAEGFRENNIRLLYNEREVIRIGGSRLNLVGIDFVRQDGRGYTRLMNGIPIEPPTVLLSHQPNVFPLAAGQGIGLMLAGHTHGGQVKFELLGSAVSPARLITRYVSGYYRLDRSHLYVSRGIGTTGPPIRINAPPEITLLTIRPD